LHNLVPEGTAQLFLPATMAQNQLGLNNMALQFFLNQKRVESIREWTPLGAYEIIYGKYDVKKMRVGLRERVGDDWKAINYIPLPHGVFAQLPVFTVLNYGLSLRSILLPGGQTDVALGQDGIYCIDSRVSQLGRNALVESGAYFLTFKRHADHVDVDITTEAPKEDIYWMFPDAELAYMWYAYFCSTTGQTLIQEISMLVQTDESFGYMLSSVRRRVLDVNDEAQLITSVQAADEVIAGEFADQFPVDPIQGGAGTSVNMNMNEVLANRACEILGHPKGSYDIVSPNNHCNMAQSTNDAFPTAIKVCAILKSKPLLEALQRLVDELEKKADEYSEILKMGRTHLQDAVPITLGQEMGAYASGIRRGIKRIKSAVEGAHVINMGATAVGTGLNAEPNYIHDVAYELSEVVGEPFYTAENLIDATNNTDVFADISSGLKVTALVLIKMANDFRLMASGPRCGIGELKLPARQPGSSIMPGKVNPVIAEVLNQVCYQVIGNDLTITLAVENGQFELNVMEPVLAYNLFNNLCYLKNGVNTFVDKLLIDLEVDREQCEYWLNRSVGIVTALLPHLGYETASALAKEAYETGRAIRDIILDQGLLTEDEINHILSPKEMTRPGIAAADLLKHKGN